MPAVATVIVTSASTPASLIIASRAPVTPAPASRTTWRSGPGVSPLSSAASPASAKTDQPIALAKQNQDGTASPFMLEDIRKVEQEGL